MNRIDERAKQVALDLIYDRRTFDGQECTYDPLQEFLQLFEGVELTSNKNARAEALAALPLFERLQRRIIDGEKVGLSDDLDAAMTDYRTWAPHILPGGILAIHDIFLDPADGGQAPHEIYKLAQASGLFEAQPMTKTLAVLCRL